MTQHLETWEVWLYAVLFIGTFPALWFLFWLADQVGLGPKGTKARKIDNDPHSS